MYIHLNDPVLKISVKDYNERDFEYRSFKKKEVYCIDGFAKEGAESIIIIPPILRNNFPFHGIRPAVLILSDELITDEVKKVIAEKNT
jgi:hypothetical protein